LVPASELVKELELVWSGIIRRSTTQMADANAHAIAAHALISNCYQHITNIAEVVG